MRRAALVIASIVALLGLSLAALGRERSGRSSGPVDALIVTESALPSSRVGKVTAIRVGDPAKLATLERFFPGCRSRPTSDRAGGWEAGYTVYLTYPKGETVRVRVSSGPLARYWSTGRGDFRTQGDFHRFVEELRR